MGLPFALYEIWGWIISWINIIVVSKSQKREKDVFTKLILNIDLCYNRVRNNTALWRCQTKFTKNHLYLTKFYSFSLCRTRNSIQSQKKCFFVSEPLSAEQRIKNISKKGLLWSSLKKSVKSTLHLLQKNWQSAVEPVWHCFLFLCKQI